MHCDKVQKVSVCLLGQHPNQPALREAPGKNYVTETRITRQTFVILYAGSGSPTSAVDALVEAVFAVLGAVAELVEMNARVCAETLHVIECTLHRCLLRACNQDRKLR